MAQRSARGAGRSGSGRGRSEVSNTSQSQNNAKSQPSVRGPNLLEQVPNNPSGRKFITVESADEFSDQSTVIRAMTCLLKTSFKGAWTTWRKVGKDHRDAMWTHFKGLFYWSEEYDALAYKVWDKCMQRRFYDTMRKAREHAVKSAQDANVNASFEHNVALLKPYHPLWIKRELWDEMIDKVWNTSKWKRVSRSGKRNRNQMEDGTISKHCGGSISIRQHKKKMEVELKRPPTGIEVYARMHTKKSTQEYITPKAAKTMEAYENAMVAKFGEDTTSHPLLDNETWCDVVGGIKKGRIFGWGSLPDPAGFLTGTSSTIPSREDMYERVREELREEMDAKAAEIEVKHQKMREEMDAKAAAMEAKAVEIDAKQKQMDAKYEAMEKIFDAMQNMRGN